MTDRPDAESPEPPWARVHKAEWDHRDFYLELQDDSFLSGEIHRGGYFYVWDIEATQKEVGVGSWLLKAAVRAAVERGVTEVRSLFLNKASLKLFARVFGSENLSLTVEGETPRTYEEALADYPELDEHALSEGLEEDLRLVTAVVQVDRDMVADWPKVIAD